MPLHRVVVARELATITRPRTQGRYLSVRVTVTPKRRTVKRTLRVTIVSDGIRRILARRPFLQDGGRGVVREFQYQCHAVLIYKSEDAVRVDEKVIVVEM